MLLYSLAQFHLCREGLYHLTVALGLLVASHTVLQLFLTGYRSFGGRPVLGRFTFDSRILTFLLWSSTLL